ncbi:helicase HerA domain-containing protein [Jiella sonneratiae]|uniref:DUF853 family protein n=1 Tax=Jiella sonneratiae TaxID=2816856 RepID=A0ABS3J285_9HYPH|nr:DUF87 domain-containing protein [Jiella sonneratiae]MBO0902696.1 DUF853 family protein [Jiella sonneratiae]
MPKIAVSPFDRARYLGTVTAVSPLDVRLNLPFGTEIASARYAGHAIDRGQVGEFVVIEGQTSAVLGRMVEIRLPDRDRLSVEPEREDRGDAANPIGVVRLLGSVDLVSGHSSRGIPSAPRVGEFVYLAHPEFLRHAIDSAIDRMGSSVRIGHLTGSQDSEIVMSAMAVFGRHCAILGSTGGGKSWTTAHLVEEIARLGGKVLLIDPTGEYHSLEGATHLHLGGRREGEDDTRRFVSFPHRHLNETDLFALLQPSQGVQAPKLRDAVLSLKLLHLHPELGKDGCLHKAMQRKKPINQKLLERDAELRKAGAPYDIGQLALQIYFECVSPSGGDVLHWGGMHEFSASSCTSLCMRVESAVKSDHLKPLFAPEDYMSDVTEEIDAFLGGEISILRVSMQYLPFEQSARELVVNALGRHLLAKARDGQFKLRPMVVVLDEAHQFLSKTIGDEFNRVSLDAFGLIAKEGRKYGLTTVMATQRPRDIPEDVLSQVGLMIVHRLINERDQGVIVNASGAIDASMAAFLPTLREGEALIIGSGALMPLPVQVTPPKRRPDLSDGVGGTWIRLEAPPRPKAAAPSRAAAAKAESPAVRRRGRPPRPAA